MAKFYVNKNAQSDGYHEVHDDGVKCPHPPDKANRVEIGSFLTCTAALQSVRAANPALRFDGCYHCTNCHTR
jgi:hypothetical protein